MWREYCVTCLLVIHVTRCYSDALHTYFGQKICNTDILLKGIWGVDFYGARINFHRYSTGPDVKQFSCKASISTNDFMSSHILFTLVSDIKGSNVKICLEPLADNNCVKNRNDVMRSSRSKTSELVISGDTHSDTSFIMIFNEFTYSLHGICRKSDFKCNTNRCIDKSLACIPPYSFCGDGTPPCFTRTTRKPSNTVTDVTHTDADEESGTEDSTFIIVLAIVMLSVIFLIYLYVTCSCKRRGVNSGVVNGENTHLPVNTNVANTSSIILPDDRPEPNAPIEPTDKHEREKTIHNSDLPPSYEEAIGNQNTYKVVQYN